MSKLRILVLLILVAVLVDFTLENNLPTPVIKLFKFDLGTLPTFLLAYGCLALGLLAGWLGHMLRLRKKKRTAAAAALAQEQYDA